MARVSAIVRRVAAAALAILGSVAILSAQDVFVPRPQPATEGIPAVRLVSIAYAFVWVVVLLYVTLLWRRLARVEREVRTLGKDPRVAAR